MKLLKFLAFNSLLFSFNSFSAEYLAFSCRAIFAGYDVYLDSNDEEYVRVEKTAPDLGEVAESKIVSKGPVFTVYFIDEHGPQMLINAVDNNHQLRKVTKEGLDGEILESDLVSDKISCENKY